MEEIQTELPEKVSVPGHITDGDVTETPHDIECGVTNYGNVVFDELASMRDRNMFCDVTFEVNSNRYRGHRLLLASISTYFRWIFCRTESSVIRIRNMRSEIFESILKFAYTGTITITQANVFEIMFASRCLQITQLTDMCVEVASHLIDPENCFDVMNFARELHLQSLLDKTEEFIVRNQEKLFSESKICMNSLESVLSFFNDRSRQLTRNGLPISSSTRETYFVKYLLNFVSSKGADEDFVELIKSVNLPALPAAKWKNLLQSHKDLLGNALVQYLLELSDLHRQGQHHDCMPALWDIVPQGKWNIVLDKPTNHPTEGYVVNISEFNDKWLTEPDVVVTSIELYFRPWWFTDTKTTDVLGGVKISYDNGLEICHGLEPKSLSTKDVELVKTYKTTLTSGELIHAIEMAFGWCVSRITFHTNKGRQLGPFGGTGGDLHKYEAPADVHFGHFHCFRGRVIKTYNMLALSHLQIGWAHYQTGGIKEDDQIRVSEDNTIKDEDREVTCWRESGEID